jgi:OOP family OmpA-OmpF porin
MKKFILIIAFSTISGYCPAQLLDRIRSKVEQKVVNQVDQSIDKALEKKKQKEPTAGTVKSSSETPPAQTNHSSIPDSPATSAGAQPQLATADLTSYSRFDFVPGSKIILHEDFSQDEIGDFPATWNTRSGAELVSVAGRKGKWLRFNQNGVFFPEQLTSELPENFTLQLDLMGNKEISNIGGLMISLIKADDDKQKFELAQSDHPATPCFKITFQPTASDKGELKYSSNLIGQQYKYGVPEFRAGKNTVKVAIWRQKQRVRVYLDSTKVLDLPRALDVATTLNTLAFTAVNPDFNQKGGAFFLGNIVLAVGAADTRNKLMSEGKFSTHGILFDVNSDQILPQSYGVLKDIAQVLQENVDVKVQIVGHTDSDGNDESNMQLSKRRAEAVKKMISTQFAIDASRLETDGKGETAPIDSNETRTGKSNNRRVEFIKL